MSQNIMLDDDYEQTDNRLTNERTNERTNEPVLSHEFILTDRLQKIRQIINKYGEDNFYLAFSGGRDSTVLSALLDMAVPDNKIPRVYANTGIELNMIRDFVMDMAKHDDRIVIIQPSTPIKPTLESKGYPFKSKVFSKYVERYRRLGRCKSVEVFIGESSEKKWSALFSCPNKLKYLFSGDYEPTFPISMECCIEMKEKPMIEWQEKNNKKYSIIGIMRTENGGRTKAQCLRLDSKEELQSFQPLVAVTNEWEDWFIQEYNVKICDIYKPPYSFSRTGCKGCPYAKDLQHELDVLEKFFPAERRQCEIIWKPVYDEYRRIGYRLKGGFDHQITIEEYLKGAKNEETKIAFQD